MTKPQSPKAITANGYQPLMDGRRWTEVSAPERSPAPSRSAATPKQIIYLKVLLAQYGTREERAMNVDRLPKSVASDVIALMHNRKRTKA